MNLRELWEFYLAAHEYRGGEFQITELPHECRGPVASIRISRTELRIRAEWLAMQPSPGRWQSITPPMGFVWHFPIETSDRALATMIVDEGEDGRLDFEIPGMGTYALLPAGSPARLRAAQVRGLPT